MARLNEIPQATALPVTESVEVLKRRFIRQNREITRVNCTQSVRIRNLETEISRLLAENISLREQAIAAALEAEKWRTSNHVNFKVKAVRDKLDRKLAEVGGLVRELGLVVEKDGRAGMTSTDEDVRWSVLAQQHDPSLKGPNENDWRSRQAQLLAEREAQAAEGRLPVIQEDKYYPRKTLEAGELKLLPTVATTEKLDLSQSPDLGPPPVARFEMPDPVKFDMGTTQDELPAAGDTVQLSSNLETRRKRRTSSLLSEISDMNTAKDLTTDPEPIQHIQLGAKRKLEASDLDQPVAQTSTEKEDFVFQRRSLASRGSRFSRPQVQHAIPDSTSTNDQSRSTGSSRKILAPKSVNSPTKQKVMITDDLQKGKPNNYKNGPDDRPAIQPTVAPRFLQPLPPAKITLDGNEDEDAATHPPKTPAGFDDILSPFSTEPSIKADARPTEAAMLTSVEDVLNGSIGRGSRRARAAVSYAEPNLRDKMRRPGKALVGAVEGIDRTREHLQCRSSTSGLDRSTSEESATTAEGLRLVKIKPDRTRGVDDNRWQGVMVNNAKDDPASPLGGKEVKQITKKSSNPIDTESLQGLAARTSRASSIFDLPGSSPLNKSDNRPSSSGSISPTSTKRGPNHPTSSTQSRRHSVQPSLDSLDVGSNPRPAFGVNRPNKTSSTILSQQDSSSTKTNPHLSIQQPLRDQGIGVGQENTLPPMLVSQKKSSASNPRNSSSSAKQNQDPDGVSHTERENPRAGNAAMVSRSVSRRRSMMV